MPTSIADGAALLIGEEVAIGDNFFERRSGEFAQGPDLLQKFEVVLCLIQPHEKCGYQCIEVLVLRIVRPQLFEFDEAGVDPRRIGAIGVW